VSVRYCPIYRLSVLFLLLQRPSRPTLFPYTTLFRSQHVRQYAPAVINMLYRATATTLLALLFSFLILIDLGRIKRGISQLKSSRDRKSTRLNSSHVKISYAVFCLKKKK